jgi:hypothetical protein
MAFFIGDNRMCAGRLPGSRKGRDGSFDRWNSLLAFLWGERMKTSKVVPIGMRTDLLSQNDKKLVPPRRRLETGRACKSHKTAGAGRNG